LIRGKPGQEFRIEIHAKARAAAVLAHCVAVLEIMIEAAVGHCREQSFVARGVEHVLHVNMVEGMLPKLAPLNRGDELLLHRLCRTRLAGGCGLNIHP
jgi:hypothetical protein